MSKGVSKVRPALASRQKTQELFDPGFKLDPYELSNDLKAELDKKGLVGRFINTTEMGKYGGYHPKGWRPYKRDVQDNSEFAAIFGKDPDGYVRRGDLILGVKTKEEVAKHRAYLAQKASEQEIKKVSKRSGQVLKEYVKDLGISEDVAVTEDWED